ncbi:MAG: right-handed parallel beta-helix repeat-containing protein, partial [Methanosarcinales archaeon]|nr:right-handed parallel beta-helix repeat-containing protein [Methanosarcinales archaeon]
INATNQSADAWLFLNFSYSDDDVTGLTESDMKVWKHNGTVWLKDGWNGTRYLDTTGNVVGVNITSFSVFAPAAPKTAANHVPSDPTNLANMTGSYWVNYTWSSGASNVTDSYNVSLNGTWANGTTNTFANMNVGPSGWANITVFAYNASGTGTLSAGSVSDEVQASAASTSCTCGDICVNQSGWWRDGGTLNASGTPLQAAVDNAIAGETICVAAGSYTENVNIATPHLTLAGEGAGVVNVTANSSSDHVFNVTADYVNISGFNVTGATGSDKAGIYLNGTDHCNISESAASDNYYGICLLSSSNNTLANNNASSNNNYGIWLDYSSNNTLTGNTARSNNYYGIGLYESSDNTLTENNANSNNYEGIHLEDSSDNTLASNTASLNNDAGIYLEDSSDNTLTSNTASSNNYYGIYLYSSSDNTLANNTASNNDDGIYLEYSSSNTLANNTASNNDDGIELYDSSDNTLANNTASSNDYEGIYLAYSSNNTLTSNTADSNNEWDIYIRSSDATFTNNTLNGTTISFTYSGDVSLKGAGSPAADPAGQQTIGKFINATNQSADAWLYLNFSYSEDDVSGLAESDLKVWKHNGTVWLEDGWNGSRYLDNTGNVVGVNITSFSVFAPAAPKTAANHVPPDPTNLANMTGSYWVNYTWSSGASNVTDSYNVSLNG